VPEGKLGDWEKSNIELFRSAAPSVVAITVEKRGDPLRGVSGMQGAGSGFVWDKAGHIITNYHVIAGADIVQVQLHAGEPIKAKVVGGSPLYDIAVVQLVDVPDNLQPIAVGNSKTLQVGQATYAIGNPFGLSRTLTTGIISALERHLPTCGRARSSGSHSNRCIHQSRQFGRAATRQFGTTHRSEHGNLLRVWRVSRYRLCYPGGPCYSQCAADHRDGKSGAARHRHRGGR
jgi:S1-C subfamily serine protease